MAEFDARYIVVEGPIGVGKTTLARRLAGSLDGEAILEAPEENPFLARFYHYEGAPLVIVNAAEIDFAHGDADYELLFDKVHSISRGRHYLNPLPL